MTKFEIQIEAISDDEWIKYLASYNETTKIFSYTPIPERFILDNGEDPAIDLNFNIDKIEDISQKTSSYSKNFILPDSAVNRKAFHNLATLGYDGGYNSNRKAKCYVYSDSVVVFEGYLQWKSFNGVAGISSGYEVVIYTALYDFATRVGDTKLTDLDWSGVIFKRDLNSMKASWDPQQSLEYYFPLIDYNWNLYQRHVESEPGGSAEINSNGLFIENFYPGMYLRSYIDRIFTLAGYRYRSDFFNSDQFGKMFIPYNGAKDIKRRDIHPSDPTKP